MTSIRMVGCLLAVWRAYEYFYYRNYVWNLRMFGEDNIPQFNAALNVAFISLLNVFSAAMPVFGIAHVAASFHINAIFIGGLTIGWVLANYHVLARHGRYKKIVSRFGREPRSKKIRHVVYCWLYFIASVAGVFLSAHYTRQLHL